MVEKFFKIHQTLHGYSDGHRLIRSSKTLTPSVERTMLVLSDMSGASMVQGFEGYLTGYPVIDIKSYVLARTWYAPEMKRPGCVWTHSLLIDNSTLAHINNLDMLLPLFVRPSSDRNTWDTFEIALELNPDQGIKQIDQDIPDAQWMHLARQAVSALYGSPSHQIFLPVDKTGELYETLTVALWTQQWARLRRSFSFCTGSISDRKLPERTFDWQVIPRAVSREVKLSTKNGVFLESFQNKSIDEEWISTAVNDLSNENVELRKFLRVFGAETLRGRGDYSPLLSLFLNVNKLHKSSDSLSALIDTVADIFPSSTEGTQMKASFFGGAVSTRSRIPTFHSSSSEAIVLEALTKTKHTAAFDGTTMMIESRAAALLEDDPAAAVRILDSILQSPQLTPIGEMFVSGIFNRIAETESYRFSEHEYNVLLLLLKRYKILGASSNVWRTTPEQQRAIFEALTCERVLDLAELRGMIGAMLQANSDVLIGDISHAYPTATVDTLMDWSRTASIEEVSKLSFNWRNVLATHTSYCVDFLNRNAAPTLPTAMLLAFSIDPNSAIVLASGSDRWIELAKNANTMLKGHLLSRVVSFTLSIGFNNPDEKSIRLLELSFARVHSAAEQNWLAESDWLLLSPHAPSSVKIASWDKCARLRNALTEHYMRYHLPAQSFLNCLEDPDILQNVVSQILERGVWFNNQRTYVAHIAQEALAGRLQATAKQKRVLKNLLS